MQGSEVEQRVRQQVVVPAVVVAPAVEFVSAVVASAWVELLLGLPRVPQRRLAVLGLQSLEYSIHCRWRWGGILQCLRTPKHWVLLPEQGEDRLPVLWRVARSQARLQVQVLAERVLAERVLVARVGQGLVPRLMPPRLLKAPSISRCIWDTSQACRHAEQKR